MLIGPIKCVMCKRRNAKIMPNIQNDAISTKRPAFCSLTCAAKWAMNNIEYSMHMCSSGEQWESNPKSCEPCNKCGIEFE